MFPKLFMKWGNIWYRDQKLINCYAAKQKFIIWAFPWHFFGKCLSARVFFFRTNQETAITGVLAKLDFVCIHDSCIQDNTEPRTITLREKCPYSDFFCSVFSRIRSECGEIPRISPTQSKCEKIRTRKTPSTDTFHAALRFPYFILCKPTNEKRVVGRSLLRC